MPAIFPERHTICRAIAVGGMSKEELRKELREAGIEMNELGRILFASERFQTSATRRTIETVEVAVGDLGHGQGATFSRISEAAAGLGLLLCPLEVGPHLRLQYRDQPEGHRADVDSRHRAPPGSVTVASPPLTDDHDFPKGFYLRRIKGTLWLRGYRSDDEHIWEPEDRFIFCRPPDGTHG